MAQPSGSIKPGNGGYPAQTSSAWSYAYFCFRLPFQPSHWAGDNDDLRHSVIVGRQHTIAAAITLTDKWAFTADMWPISLPPVDTAGGGGVSAAWAMRTQSPALNGQNPGAPPLSDPDTLPQYSRGRIAFQESGAGTTEILGVYVEHTCEEAYTAPDPSGARNAERTDRGANRTYSRDAAATAWHASWVVSHTMNKIEYEARQVWSVPI